MINPFHIQPGLLMDIDITSIKRKKATLDGMANVLNEFLHSVSKGFQDAAFASFSRRRSTVRVDLSQSFAPPELDEKGDAGKGNSPAKELLAEASASQEEKDVIEEVIADYNEGKEELEKIKEEIRKLKEEQEQ